MNQFTLTTEQKLSVKFINTNVYVGQAAHFTFNVKSVKISDKTIIFTMQINLVEDDVEINYNDDYCGNASVESDIMCEISLNIHDFLATIDNPTDVADITSLKVDTLYININNFNMLHVENNKYAIKDLITSQRQMMEDMFDRDLMAGIQIQCVEDNSLFSIK